MQVKATQLGYYGNTRIREGKVFGLKDKKDFSKNWMVELKPKSEPEKKGFSKK